MSEIAVDKLAELLATARRHIHTGEAQAGIAFAEKARDMAFALADHKAAAEAAYQLGLMQRVASRNAAAADSFDEAELLFRDLGDHHGLAQVALQRGQLYLDLGDYANAIDHFEQTRKVAQDTDDAALHSRLLTGIGIASTYARDYGRAQSAFEAALALQRAGNDPGAANSLQCLAVLELRVVEANDAANNNSPRIERIERALQLLQESLQLARGAGRRKLEGNCLAEIGKAMRLRGELDEAVDCCLQGIAIFRALTTPKDECDALLQIALAYLTHGQPAAARQYAEQGLALARACGFRPMERDALDVMLRCAEAAGDMLAAFTHVKAARAIEHQIRDGDALRRIDRLEHHAMVERSSARLAALEARNRELDRLATTDPLTGLLNRRGLEIAYRQRTQSGNVRLAALAVDLDRFKAVNDRYGHATGDVVLQSAARVMQRLCRDGDILGRWGGEEFLLLVVADSPQQSFRVAERIRVAVHEMELEALAGERVTLSAGIAIAGETESLHALLERADAALYRAKAQGRDRTVIDYNAPVRRSATGS